MAALKTNVTELPESRVRVEAEVPAEEVERRIQQAARQLGRQMRIPGFRKGKVPPPVVIRRLGRQTVLDEAVQSSLSSWYVDAIDGAGITPIGEPELKLGDLPGEGQPLSFSIEIGVRPRAELAEYRGLEVGRRAPQVEESAIDGELETLRDRFATLDTVERAAAGGDHLVIDYLGAVDGVPFDGGEGRDQLLELGSGRLVPGFEEQLEGVQAGETRTVNVTFPADYPTELAGQAATFEVTVTEVKSKRLPELNDEFAGEASEFDTLAELREDIGKRLAANDEQAIEREFEEAVLEAVVRSAKIEIPDKLVHSRAHELLDQRLAALAPILERQGISREEYVGALGQDVESLAHEAEPEAAAMLRREAVLAAIVEAEGIEPSEDDLKQALEPTAQRNDTTAELLLEQLRTRGRLEQLAEDVASRQALELIVREATPISVEQAQARDRLWTPGKEPAAEGSEEPPPGRLWTPGS